MQVYPCMTPVSYKLLASSYPVYRSHLATSDTYGEVCEIRKCMACVWYHVCLDQRKDRREQKTSMFRPVDSLFKCIASEDLSSG